MDTLRVAILPGAAWGDEPAACFYFSSGHRRFSQMHSPMRSLNETIGLWVLFIAVLASAGGCSSPIALAKKAFNRGHGALERGEWELAIFEYDTAIGQNPRYAEAYHARGIAYSQLGDYRREIEDFSEAIRLKPDFADAYYDRGFAYWRQGDRERELADYKEAVRLKPDFRGAYYNNDSGSRANSENAERSSDAPSDAEQASDGQAARPFSD